MEFCNISKPFLVWGLRIELSVKYVFGDILRILRPVGTPIVRIFYRRLYVKLTTDTQYSFIIGLYAMITVQIIPDSPVSFVRGIFVFLFCRPICGFMPDQTQPRLLSISLSFLRRISLFLPVPFLLASVLPWHVVFRVPSFPLGLFFHAVLQGIHSSRFVFHGVIPVCW